MIEHIKIYSKRIVSDIIDCSKKKLNKETTKKLEQNIRGIK